MKVDKHKTPNNLFIASEIKDHKLGSELKTWVILHTLV